MNFSKIDLIPVLGSSMPCRFADMPPSDFELFVAQFFRDTGCLVEQVKHGSDFGIDVIVTRERKRIAIQVKRYAPANKVGVADVNQAVGGRKFYNCDHAIFLTTSDFTKPARRLAQQTEVELWDWNEFQRRLSAAYLGGKSYQEYFRAPVSVVDGDEPVAARVLRIEKLHMKGNYEGALFYIGLSNQTAKNTDAHIVGATYITVENNQYSMRDYLQGYFMDGVIYARCTVEVCIIFDLAQVRHVRRGHAIILDLVTEGTERSAVLQVPFGNRLFAPWSAPSPLGWVLIAGSAALWAFVWMC